MKILFILIVLLFSAAIIRYNGMRRFILYLTAILLLPAGKLIIKLVSAIIKPKADPPLKVTLTEVELKAYFPSPLPSPFVIKQTIYEALSMRKKALEKQAKKDAAKDTVKAAVKPAR